jgi:hypothetical protein
MKRAHGNRAWRGLMLASAIGAVAALALSGLASARDRGGNGHHHGADTGTIASFDQSTDMLAITLSGEGGATIGGLVTPHTKIRCEDEHAPDVSARALKRDSGGDSGPEHGSDDNGDGANCTTSDLIVGATVHDAALDLRDGEAIWDEVELP